MKIGVDIKAFKNGKTGIARYLRSLLDWLQKIDTCNDYVLFECTPSGYPVSNPRWKKVLLHWKMPGIAWQQLLLPLQLRKHKIELLWAPEQICPIFYRGKVVTTVHDFATFRYPETSQWPNRLIQRFLFHPTLKRSVCCLPVSDFIGRELRKMYPVMSGITEIVTVTNGSPDWEVCHRQTAEADRPFLFFAGNREPRKNLTRLIDSLEILYREGRSVALHLAGPQGWKNSMLDQKIAEGPLRNSVFYKGYLSENDLMEQYQKCTAVVYPSLYEGFGLPVLEAFCMGTRVITSRGTVMEEIAGEAAYYFDPLDVRDIARVIGDVLDLPPPDKEEYARFNKVVKRYSWERSARRMLGIFERI